MILAADWLMSPLARAVLRAVGDGGHRALFVGGCVRNAVIGAAATDIDIATDALPSGVIDLCTAAGLRVIPTGIDHGTVTVTDGAAHVEVTTFRRDVETRGRHATVAFDAGIAEDAARRDFTINALYADADGQVIDPLGTGLADLAARQVRFIGDAHARIREDFLRILRFFRFHAWYGAPDGGLDADGLAACAEEAEGIANLSRERIGGEMRKLLSAPDPAPAVAAMAMSGVLLRILPGTGANTLAVLVHVEQAAALAPDPIRRLAALGGEGVADALRLSTAESRRLERLADAMAGDLPPAALGQTLGAHDGQSAIALRAALAGREADHTALHRAAEGAGARFPVAAADLMPALSGPALGRALERLRQEWLRGDLRPDRAALLSRLDARGGDSADGLR